MEEQLLEMRRVAASRYQQLASSEAATAPPPAAPPAVVPAGPTGPVELVVLSYNIWFEFERTFGARMRVIGALCDEGAGAQRPSAVALQELTAEERALLLPRLRQAGYTLTEQTDTTSGYWCALATRAPLGPLRDGRWRPFSCGSMMGRGLVLGSAIFAPSGKKASSR
ncbi:hypothetical protein T492DRAFT_860607 [Pavlovales sp. CCMP2436]|nr:hypothetical protein T492DRAFT_860607 [Pavlovales sp. CCMP2436]